MKYCICIILFLLSINLSGQISIFADPTSGCDSVSVTFRLYPPQTASTVSSISWSFSNGITIDNELNPVVKFNTPGLYSVSCVINNTTTITETDLILVYNGPCADIIDVPNVFSPNGDGINDYFMVRTNGLNIFSFSVYTRSGILVYKTESPDLIWDGRSLSGQPLSAGIYYFVIEKLDGQTGKGKNGFIHLIR